MANACNSMEEIGSYRIVAENQFNALIDTGLYLSNENSELKHHNAVIIHNYNSLYLENQKLWAKINKLTEIKLPASEQLVEYDDRLFFIKSKNYDSNKISNGTLFSNYCIKNVCTLYFDIKFCKESMFLFQMSDNTTITVDSKDFTDTKIADIFARNGYVTNLTLPKAKIGQLLINYLSRFLKSEDSTYQKYMYNTGWTKDKYLLPNDKKNSSFSCPLCDFSFETTGRNEPQKNIRMGLKAFSFVTDETKRVLLLASFLVGLMYTRLKRENIIPDKILQLTGDKMAVNNTVELLLKAYNKFKPNIGLYDNYLSMCYEIIDHKDDIIIVDGRIGTLTNELFKKNLRALIGIFNNNNLISGEYFDEKFGAESFLTIIGYEVSLYAEGKNFINIDMQRSDFELCGNMPIRAYSPYLGDLTQYFVEYVSTKGRDIFKNFKVPETINDEYTNLYLAFINCLDLFSEFLANYGMDFYEIGLNRNYQEILQSYFSLDNLAIEDIPTLFIDTLVRLIDKKELTLLDKAGSENVDIDLQNYIYMTKEDAFITKKCLEELILKAMNINMSYNLLVNVLKDKGLLKAPKTGGKNVQKRYINNRRPYVLVFDRKILGEYDNRFEESESYGKNFIDKFLGG